ncbi:hypothetical protein [Myxococcus stipitatus]|uniref:hypothetical protein n=1 Tax=Myxococcus stipitatus TaxID=83455 RepID=UPI003AF2BA0A
MPHCRWNGARGGRPRRWDVRELFDAVLYVLRSGFRWVGRPVPVQAGDPISTRMILTDIFARV